MITEIAQIDVKPGMEAEFETGVKNAAPVFQRAKGCHGLELQRSIEKPGRYRLFVKWATVENHTVDFRGSADFQEWRKHVAHCFASPPEVEHVIRCCKGFDLHVDARESGHRIHARSNSPGGRYWSRSRGDDVTPLPAPHWQSGSARRIRGGRLRPTRRRRRGWLRGTDWRSTAGCGSCRRLCRWSIPGPD